MGKKSYVRRVYESVEDKSLSSYISQRTTENRIHAAKGYSGKNEKPHNSQARKLISYVLLMFK